MTEEQIIDDVFEKEGDEYAEPPTIDQPTGRGGITLGTLSAFFGRQCTIQDLKDLTHPQARLVVRWKLRQIETEEGLGAIPFEPLRLQVLDFAYNSGGPRAIRWLQRVLRVPRTGKMDSPTRAILQMCDGFLVNQGLLAARLQMIDMATDPGGSVDSDFEEGLENRALKFSLLEVP